MPSFRKVNPAHRPPKLTDELTKKICSTMRAGAYVETAMVVNGVAKDTFYMWCKIAHGKLKKEIGGGQVRPYTDKERKPYQVFLSAVEQAMEECTVRDLLNIDKCAMGQDFEYERDVRGNLVLNGRGNPIPKKLGLAPDWHASAWRLERRHPKQWQKSEKVENTGNAPQVQVMLTMPANGREAVISNEEE